MTTTAFADDTATLNHHFSEALTRGLARRGVLLVVTADDQKLHVVATNGLLKTFTVSTGKAGLGNKEGSGKTPLGWHVIEERIGGDEPPGRVFIRRRPTTERLTPDQWRNPDSGDYILTHILTLRGLEKGINSGKGIDSVSRGIYLHGTNQEHLLGTPASHGCIRLSNRDIMELFDIVRDRSAYCLILK